MDKVNVLIVDDSLVIRGMLTSILEADKRIHVVRAVASAAEADVVISQQLVDVLTLDIEMPGTTGLDYLPSLTRRHLPTVMLSSRTCEGSPETETAMSLGAFACFNKAHAVRDAVQLLSRVMDAAAQKGKAHSHDAKPVTAAAKAESGRVESPIGSLIAEHGSDLKRFIAEKIGFATLDRDEAAVSKWVAVARKLEGALQSAA